MTADGRVVEIRGGGVAASCCHVLLARSGIGVRRDAGRRGRVPAILISPGTQQLLQDVLDRRDLLDGLPRIDRRIVAWSSSKEVTLPHVGVVVSEDELLRRIGNVDSADATDEAPRWIIHSDRPPEHYALTPDQPTRTTRATRVRLAPEADRSACLMESAESGWLFLLPYDDTSGYLLTTGVDRDELLAASQLVSRSIAALMEDAGSFPSSPRMVEPVCGEGWLACGSAALRFDPLCGDGSGHAVREAVLACAVVSHSDPSIRVDELLREYQMRLTAGYGRHLEQCLQFYSTGGHGAWWQEQCEALRKDAGQLSRRHVTASPDRLQLNGFVLQRAARR